MTLFKNTEFGIIDPIIYISCSALFRGSGKLMGASKNVFGTPLLKSGKINAERPVFLTWQRLNHSATAMQGVPFVLR